MASTSGRSSLVGSKTCWPSVLHQTSPLQKRKSRSILCPDTVCSSTPLLRHALARHRARPVAATVCQAQKTKQESERPVMERLESDMIAGVDSNGNGVQRNGSKAPSKNSATNVADRTNTPPAETSQDEDGNVDSGAQSHEERSNGSTLAKAASKVPGGLTEADSMSALKPASFWLPQPEVMQQVRTS